MKLIIVLLLACIVAALAQEGPIQLTHNNVGDIINIDVNADMVMSNNVESNIINLLAALINQQAAVVGNPEMLPQPAAESE